MNEVGSILDEYDVFNKVSNDAEFVKHNGVFYQRMSFSDGQYDENTWTPWNPGFDNIPKEDGEYKYDAENDEYIKLKEVGDGTKTSVA